MHIAANEIETTMVRVFARAGLPPDDARTVAEVLLDAELTGRNGHGLIRVPGIVKRAAGRSSRHITITRDTGTTIALDGGGALGYLAACRATDLVRERLARQPLAAAAVRNADHTGAIGYYVRQLAEAGYAGLAMAHCEPFVAPHGGRSAVFGTNPFAFAVPHDPVPIVCDMSPARVTYGSIMKAQRDGATIPPDCAIGPGGQMTEDPAQALAGAILPIGGAKGGALACAVQLIAGPLCGAAAAPESLTNYGFFLLGMRLDAFGDAEAVAQGVAEVAARVHHAGADCPGEGSERRRQQHLLQGIEVDPALWDQVRTLAGR